MEIDLYYCPIEVFTTNHLLKKFIGNIRFFFFSFFYSIVHFVWRINDDAQKSKYYIYIYIYTYLFVQLFNVVFSPSRNDMVVLKKTDSKGRRYEKIYIYRIAHDVRV